MPRTLNMLPSIAPALPATRPGIGSGMAASGWRRLAWILLIAASPCTTAFADQASPAVAVPTSHDAAGVVDLGIERHSLSDGFGDWRGTHLRGVWFASPETVVHYELVDTRRFNARGRFGSLGVTRTLDDRWYVSGSAGAGDGAFFFPDWRVDVAINRKWLDDRSLVTTIGYTQYNAPDGHVDRTALLGLTWYAPRHWVLEAGLRPNRSSPGAVRSNSGYLAATWGEDGKQYLTLRHERGREAYQTIGDNILLVDTPSRVSSVAWRRWLTRRCGFNVRLERYDNPNYRRRGGEAGGFCGF
ncbi:MAG: YaiO family outer membrane beta-barrel protein [Pseudomonadota bacterium]|nr:YaiO family outer membrane beta-barrel protein [Pseudomonadota bacterium]